MLLSKYFFCHDAIGAGPLLGNVLYVERISGLLQEKRLLEIYQLEDREFSFSFSAWTHEYEDLPSERSDLPFQGCFLVIA